MKKITFLFLISIFSFNAYSTVRTVSNAPINAGTFTDIQTAINASALGDTVYVHGSPTAYTGTLTINKRLTLIGPGGYITGTVGNNFPATISGQITVDSSLSTHFPTGTKIIGIYCDNALQIRKGNNILIDRCVINQIGFSDQGNPNIRMVVKNTSAYLINGYDPLCCYQTVNFFLTITNCFSSYISYMGQNTVILNNVIKNTLTGFNGTNFSNNIFYYTTFDNVDNCVFSNNVNFGSPNQLTLPYGTNTGGGNLNQQDPLFIGSIPLNVAWNDLDDNWGLQASSPCINAGTDGTNIGPSGGSNPLPNWFGVPNIPQMQELNILNGAVPQNGTLDIQVKARKRN
jgi:hypothetical protein